MPTLRDLRPLRLFLAMESLALQILILMGSSTQVVMARADPAAVCDHAAQQVAQESGVPLNVLRAITRTETGRGSGSDLRPWPWTVNMEGHGVWFDTADQAQVYVFRHFQRGARSFDVGCFQINYKWHGQAFNSIEEMFDPLINARYAARYLKKLHGEFGDWNRAAGAYHSRTQKYATRYLKRYAAIRDGLEPSIVTAPDTHLTEPRRNRFPLLTGVPGNGQNGSLFPSGTAQAASLFAPQRQD